MSKRKRSENGSSISNNNSIINNKDPCSLSNIPCIDFEDLRGTTKKIDIKHEYRKSLALHLKSYRQYLDKFNNNNKPNDFTWKSIAALFSSLSKDQESWCIENQGTTTTTTTTTTTPQDFLLPNNNNDDDDDKVTSQKASPPPPVGYCSFLLQNDHDIYHQTLSQLPVSRLAVGNDNNDGDDNDNLSYTPCLWFFFGRNSARQPMTKGTTTAATPLLGRPEHTDSVSQDGTWHYQLSGIKRWYLRPTETLLQNKRHNLDNTRFVVDCYEGDVLIVNTRLWWHQTELPVQSTPSVSYARDFYFQENALPSTSTTNGDNQTNTIASTTTPGTFSNLDGIYATNDVEEGEIIFTEQDLPDGELHRSKTHYNCQVMPIEISDNNDGDNDNAATTIQAVVACRRIACGEFFCLAESDEEDDKDDDDDKEEEDCEEEEPEEGL